MNINHIQMGATNIIKAFLGNTVIYQKAVDGYSSLSLFAGGKQGVWFDPSDLSTIFQDSTGTIPVTTVGDPVGLMKDKSGNLKHASQSVSSKRPVYSGLSYDGVDDGLTVNGWQLPALGDFTLIVKFRRSNVVNTSEESVFSQYTISGTGRLLLRISPANSGDMFDLFVGGVASPKLPISPTEVVTLIIRRAGSSFLVEKSTGESTTLTSSASITNTPLLIGQGAAGRFEGKIGAFIALDRYLTNAEVADAKLYMESIPL